MEEIGSPALFHSGVAATAATCHCEVVGLRRRVHSLWGLDSEVSIGSVLASTHLAVLPAANSETLLRCCQRAFQHLATNAKLADDNAKTPTSASLCRSHQVSTRFPLTAARDSIYDDSICGPVFYLVLHRWIRPNAFNRVAACAT